MNIFEFKLMAAIAIFFASFIVGLVPTAMSQNHPRAMSILEAAASGVFLGAALFHMLPDSERVFQMIGYHRLPYSMMLCVLMFFVLLVVEQTAKYFLHHTTTNTVTSMLLLLVLSIHALIAGAALGINEEIANALVIFIAIIAHKSSESFALVVALHKSCKNNRTVILMLFLFSLVTPSGILLATSISSAMASEQAALSEAIFNALTAGTFLYVGTLDTLCRQLNPERMISRVGEFLSLLSGMAMMGIVALWI